MGFKSLQSNKQYKVGGLIFSNKYDYELYKSINDDVSNILLNTENEEQIKDFFNDFENIKVIEDYPDASEELGLFSDITELLCFECSEQDYLDYKFACMFFSKFKF